MGCSALKNVALPEGLVRIDNYAFDSCNLETLILPASLAELGWCVFENCTVGTVYYAGDQAQWEQIHSDGENDHLQYSVPRDCRASGGCADTEGRLFWVWLPDAGEMRVFGNVNPCDPVYAAVYGPDGRMAGLSAFAAPGASAAVTEDADVRVFWLNWRGVPRMAILRPFDA